MDSRPVYLQGRGRGRGRQPTGTRQNSEGTGRPNGGGSWRQNHNSYPGYGQPGYHGDSHSNKSSTAENNCYHGNSSGPRSPSRKPVYTARQTSDVAGLQGMLFPRSVPYIAGLSAYLPSSPSLSPSAPPIQ